MKFRSLFEIILLGALWGPSYLFIKVALDQLSPFSIAAGRTVIGVGLLYLLLKIKRRSLPKDKKVWGHLLVMGFFSVGLPFILFGFAEQRISSALAGIINGMTPIVVVLLAHYLLKDERLNVNRVVGVLLGLCGFLALLLPRFLSTEIDGDPIGILYALGAAVSYSLGMVYARRYCSNLPPLVAPFGQLALSALYLLPLAFVTEPFFANEPLTWQGITAVLGLGVLGTTLAFVVYFRILARSGAGYLAMATYLLPLFSTVLGTLFLNESLTWFTILAGLLILLGMTVVGGTIKLPGIAKRKLD